MTTKPFPYQITNLRFSVGQAGGVLYGQVVDLDGKLCVSANLDFCVKWIKNEMVEENVNKNKAGKDF